MLSRNCSLHDSLTCDIRWLAEYSLPGNAEGTLRKATPFQCREIGRGLARFQRDWHQPPGRDCQRKSRTAMSRVQYPKGIAPWVAYRKGHIQDLPWSTNGGMPLRGIPPYDFNGMARKPNAVCANRGLQHEAGPAESALAKPSQDSKQQFNGLFRRMFGSRYLHGLQGSRAGFRQREEDRPSLAGSACLETFPPAKDGRIVYAADLRALAYAFLLRDRMEKKKPFILAAQPCQAGAGQGVESSLAISAAITWKAARRPPSLHIPIGAVRTHPARRGRRCFGGGTSMLLISSAVQGRITTHCAVGRVGRTAVSHG